MIHIFMVQRMQCKLVAAILVNTPDPTHGQSAVKLPLRILCPLRRDQAVIQVVRSLESVLIENMDQFLILFDAVVIAERHSLGLIVRKPKKHIVHISSPKPCEHQRTRMKHAVFHPAQQNLHSCPAQYSPSLRPRA